MIIRGAKAVVKGKLVRADVLVEDGKIARIASGMEESGETIEAGGLLLLPGMIDAHVHLRDPGMTRKEDFYTGTRAALAGGITTAIDMPNNKPPASTAGAFREKKEIAKSKAVCDYALYFAGVNGNQKEVSAAKPDFLKVYLGHSTGDLGVSGEEAEKHFQSFEKNKVLAVHAEDEECMQKARAAREGTRLDASMHNLLRPKECALKSVEKAAKWTKELKRKTHLCHATSKEEVELARANGMTVEATPHHLFLSTRDVERLGNFGKVNPPIREPGDVAGLWACLEKIDCIGSDHAPHLIEEKEQDYENAPSGVPELETTLALFIDAVKKGRVSLEKVVELTSTNPARVFGLKEKGEIVVGKDADLILVDANEKWIVRGDGLETKCKWSPFEGRELHGRVKKTILRGELAFEDGQVVARKGFGKPARV